MQADPSVLSQSAEVRISGHKRCVCSICQVCGKGIRVRDPVTGFEPCGRLNVGVGNAHHLNVHQEHLLHQKTSGILTETLRCDVEDFTQVDTAHREDHLPIRGTNQEGINFSGCRLPSAEPLQDRPRIQNKGAIRLHQSEASARRGKARTPAPACAHRLCPSGRPVSH